MLQCRWEATIDPNPSYDFLQSGRMPKHRFSDFASTKQPFVISGSRPNGDIQDLECMAAALQLAAIQRLKEEACGQRTLRQLAAPWVDLRQAPNEVSVSPH